MLKFIASVIQDENLMTPTWKERPRVSFTSFQLESSCSIYSTTFETIWFVSLLFEHGFDEIKHFFATQYICFLPNLDFK